MVIRGGGKVLYIKGTIYNLDWDHVQYRLDKHRDVDHVQTYTHIGTEDQSIGCSGRADTCGQSI